MKRNCCAHTTVKVFSGIVDCYPTELLSDSIAKQPALPKYTLTGGEGIVQSNNASPTPIQLNNNVNTTPPNPFFNRLETSPTIIHNSDIGPLEQEPMQDDEEEWWPLTK